MADIKITDLPEIPTVDGDDILLMVDVSDETAGPNGTDKRATVGQVKELLGVVQTTGSSTNDIMSQKAVSDEFTAVSDEFTAVSDELDTKLDASYMTLKIFQSPTDGGLTKIQTRTVDAGEVYEVRKVSDDSLATIYSDKEGDDEIVQDGTSNVSGSDGVVEFYIADGDYYVGADGVTNNFSVSGGVNVIDVSGIAILPTLLAMEDSGYYRCSNVTDTPSLNGILVAVISDTAGLNGFAEFTRYGSTPIKSIATLLGGEWSEWKEVLTSDNLTAEYIEGAGGFYNRGGVLVEKSEIYSIGSGSYSWWCEPNVNMLSELTPFVAIGCVGSGSARTHLNSPSSNTNSTVTVDAVTDIYGDSYKGDEHNSPVTFVVDGNICMFFAGHADDGKIWMAKGVGLDPNTLSRPVVIYDDPDNATSYVQLLQCSDGVYLFYRSTPTKWKLLFSTDGGDTWEARNLVESAGTQQLYFRATTTGYSGNIVRIIALYHPNFRDENRIWTASINLGTRKVTLTGGIEVGDITTAGNTATITTDMSEVFTNVGRRTRLFDIQHSQTSTLKLLIADYSTSNMDGSYKYLEYDYGSSSLTKESVICDAGGAVGDGYHAGCSFQDVQWGQGNPVPYPIFSIREDNGSWILEEYTSADAGVTWRINRTLRTLTDGTKMWRPKKPYNARWRQGYKDIDVVWNEGTFDGYKDYDSTIYAKLSVANPL